MGPFEFGNTTVRSAVRLRDGLIAIANSGKEGQLRERTGDLALIELLVGAGIVDERGDETYSVGRKWRAALCKLGFLFDKYEQDLEDIGEIDHITPGGKRLIEANSLAAQQECFLRAIAAMQLAYNGKSYRVGPGFSPFKHVVKVLLELEKEFGSSQISFIEFASFGQFAPSKDGVAEIVDGIAKHRVHRTEAVNKKQYDMATLQNSVLRNGRVALSSYVDYADENIRYLKSTGCFTSVGRGLAISASKHRLLCDLIESIPEETRPGLYWQNATAGVHLPTDDPEFAAESLSQLEVEAKARGIAVSEKSSRNDVRAINSMRYDLEELIALDAEKEFAYRQRHEGDEIIQYLTALIPRSRRVEELAQNTEIEIPRGEGPAYLEWAVWRAFLAINSIKNPPSESRRFKIDRDFLPVSHAPGNGPDLIFEFSQYTLIVEVTLLTSDRQSSAEQVGVRRHVYEIAAANRDKPVYCLFLAPTIKNETARDFKVASYEEDDGAQLNLTIIPLGLGTFIRTFSFMLKQPTPDPALFKSIIETCAQSAVSSRSTLEWMEAIDRTFLVHA